LEKLAERIPDEKIVEAEPFVVVGIPAYNEEKTIAKVVLQATRIGDAVVVCDDGSSDMTGEIAKNLGALVVRHEKNLGYGAAIQSLFGEDASGLLQPILDGSADIVTGSRFVGEVQNKYNHIPLHRRFGIKMITKLTKSTSGVTVSDAQNGFRAYSKTALEKLALVENGMGVSVEILVKARELGLRVAEAPVACSYGDVDQPSTHNSLRHGTSVVGSLLRLVVEEQPLVFLGLPGIASLLTGVLFGVWMLQIYAAERQIVTNIALASIAFVLIGFFALSTAIMLYAISRLAAKALIKAREG